MANKNRLLWIIGIIILFVIVFNLQSKTRQKMGSTIVPISQWTFDNTLGDSIGTNILSGAENYVEGHYGNAIYLNGTAGLKNKHASLPIAPNSFTVSVWVNPRTVLGDWRTILEYNRYDSKDKSLTNWFGLWFSANGKPHFRIGMCSRTGNYTFSSETWTQYTAVFDSTTNSSTIYINGEFDSTYICSSASLGSYWSAPINNGTLTIGESNIGGEYFVGVIDELLIYNHVLTQEEIYGLVNPCTPDCSGAANVCTGETIPDGCSGICTGTKDCGISNQTTMTEAETYYDKVYGGWLGQIIGLHLVRNLEGKFIAESCNPSTTYTFSSGPVLGSVICPNGLSIYYGAPHSIHISGTCTPTDFANCNINSVTDDDANLDRLNLNIFEKYGLNPTYSNIASEWSKISVLYFANKYAKNLMEGTYLPQQGPCTGQYVCTPSGNTCPDGKCLPPLSGKKGYNPYYDYIDAQMSNEVFGFMSPGMPDVAAAYADKFARITNDGFAVDYSKFYAMMYTYAFSENNVRTIIDTVKNKFPSSSRVHEIVNDIEAWQSQNADWRVTRQLIYQKYYLQEQVTYGARPAFFIQATPNFAVTIMAILYSSDSDPAVQFDKGVQIGGLVGFDEDDDNAIVASLLGVIAGAEKIPDKWKVPVRNMVGSTEPNIGTDTITNLASRNVALGELVKAQQTQPVVGGGGGGGSVFKDCYHIENGVCKSIPVKYWEQCKNMNYYATMTECNSKLPLGGTAATETETTLEENNLHGLTIVVIIVIGILVFNPNLRKKIFKSKKGR